MLILEYQSMNEYVSQPDGLIYSTAKELLAIYHDKDNPLYDELLNENNEFALIVGNYDFVLVFRGFIIDGELPHNELILRYEGKDYTFDKDARHEQDINHIPDFHIEYLMKLI